MGLSNHPPSGGEERPPEQNIREPARSHRVTQSAQPCPELPEQLLCCASVRKTFPSQRCNVFLTSPKSQSTAASPLPAPTGTERCCAEKSSRRGRGAGTQSKGSPVHPVHPEHSLWLGNSLFLERAVAVSPEPALLCHPSHPVCSCSRGRAASYTWSTLFVQHVLRGNPGGQNQQNTTSVTSKPKEEFLWSRNAFRAS